MAADPYLAVTLDAKRRIARAALAIGADPAVWTLGYLNLMEHVWERKDARVSALVLSACFGPDPRAPAALVEFGFLVVAGEVWDLNQDDTNRLLLTYKQRVAAGKARAESAARDEKGRVQRTTSGQPAEHQRTSSGPPAASQLLHPAPSTQQKEEDLPRAPPAGPRVKKDTTQKKQPDPTRPGWQALIDRLTATYLRLVGAKYDFRGHDAKALAAMLDRGVSANLVETGWARALAHQGYPTVRKLSELDQNLNHFLGAFPAAQGGPRKPDPNQGIVTHVDPLDDPEAVAEANRRQEEWLNGS